MKRRVFLQQSSLALTALGVSPFCNAGGVGPIAPPVPFDIALSQWSFKDSIFGNSRNNYQQFKKLLHTDPDQVLQGEMDPRDIVVAARQMGVNAVDLVNILWFGHGADKRWLRSFKHLASNEGVSFVCLMCGELAHIGAKAATARQLSIDQHLYWLETAAELQCTQLRVNPYGEGTYLEQLKQCADGLQVLCDRAEKLGIQLLVENHGHPSSNGAWLAMLVEMADHRNLGVYLDLDNFFMGGWGIEPQRRYDSRQGILDLASYTVGVSAKTRQFLPNGHERTIDYNWCVETLLEHGFDGFMSAEYDGHELSDFQGAKATVDLLRSLQSKFENRQT